MGHTGGFSAEDSEFVQNAVLQGGRTSLYGVRKVNVPPKKHNPPVDNQREQSNTQARVQAEIDALKRIGVNSGRPINDLSQKVSFKSSVLINNQKVELTQQQVLSNGKILPVGTIAKLDKKGVVATFPDGKTVTYAGVTEQKALPKPDKLATSERVKKNIQETRKGNAPSNFNQHAQKEIKKLSRVPSGLIGKEFEDWLVKFHGGNGSFKMGRREFDGAITINRWYEAKSGNFWRDHTSTPQKFERFKSDMGDRLKIATKMEQHMNYIQIHQSPNMLKNF